MCVCVCSCARERACAYDMNAKVLIFTIVNKKEKKIRKRKRERERKKEKEKDRSWVEKSAGGFFKTGLVKTYQGMGGISRGIFFVLQGALKLVAQFLPNIPPNTVSGKPTATQNK